MSNTSIQEQPAQRLSSGSGQTLPSRPLQPISDPSASKRVCFYKSGDYKFSGHRVIINARTFKTFDALLDALSKKVPLPFGVRTITTPRGTHLVKSLDDLHDGGSYVCSDQKRVKPLNLDEVKRRQVPWNATRPLSAGRRRRHQGRRNDVNNRPAKVTERVAVRTPKKLVVIKNKDPTVKRTIVLQRRIAPTFDALLDYLSQVLQFPVLKLYSTDGRRVDGLAALILCSGVVVAAGNEPFRLGNYSFHRTGQMAQVMYMETVEPSMLQPRASKENNKSFSSGRGSRNFSLSSERYIVNQINKSRNGSMNSHVRQLNGSFETEVNPHHTSMETSETGRIDTELHSCIVPQDDDIEKSFRVNQDGSMTVEMKVRLTIKEEEMLHWTTTLSRSSLRKGTVRGSISESGNSSPNSNIAIAKDSSSISEDETKEENHSAGAGKGVGFNDERGYKGHTTTALGKGKTSFKRTPTPGPRYVKKKASVESVKMVTDSGVHENTLGHYSYMERTADGESTEGYCVIRHNSNSNRPIPKPRKTASAGASNKGSHSSVRSSGVAEVLQIQKNGMEVTETVMHIYESQGCYDNYVANDEYSTDGVPFHDSPEVPDSKASTASGPRSSSNDIDFSWQPPTADSLQRLKEEMLSLSSEPISSTYKIMNDLSSATENEAPAATGSQIAETAKKDKVPKNEKNKNIIKPARNHKSSTSSSDKKLKKSITPSKNSSNASVGNKSLSSSESAKNGQRSKEAEKKPEKPQSKKSIKDEKTPRKDSALVVSTESLKRTPPKRQSINKAAAKDNGHNINTPSGRPQMKKNMSDILQPKKSLLPVKTTVSKPKSMTEMRITSPKQTLELNESVSMPSLNPTPSEIHQYVENWLEKVSPDQVPYTEETFTNESEPQTKVVFQIGGDSERDETSESQNNVDEYYSQPGDAVKKSASCLSVPLYHEGQATSLLHSEQKSRGLCVSMPSVRVDPVVPENRLRAHKSAEDIGPADNELSPSNILSPKAKIKPVLRQLCSSIQCIRRVSDTNPTSNLEKSSSLPDFSTQVALVFGSSCKAFLSFLSVMTLRDSLTGSAQGDEHQSRSTSEAMLMVESLQKISAIEDEEEQRSSLTDLQSRASSQFRERWKDFQIFRERLESEPLSPRVSETEFALDVVSEGGDAFEDQNLHINELMDELNMPEDLRAEISSTIQHARTFYPVEESTFVETEKNQSDTEEEVEQFVEDYSDERKQSPEYSTCIADDITEKKQGSDDGDDVYKMQTVYPEQAKTVCESEQAGLDVKNSEISQTETDEPLNHNENETEEKEDQVVEDWKVENEEDEETNNFKGEDLENIEKESEEETEEEAVKKDGMKQDEWESGEESVEKVEEGTEEEMTVDGEEEEQEEVGEKEEVDETEGGIMDVEDQETRHSDFVDETDERTFVEETEEEEKGEEGGNEEMQVEETDEVVEETDKEGEVENIEEQDENIEELEGEDVQVAENDAEGEKEGIIEETNEGEAVNNKENEEKEEVVQVVNEGNVEEAEETAEETDEEEEEQRSVDGVGEKEVEVVKLVDEGSVEEAEETAEETDEEEEEQKSVDGVGEKEVEVVELVDEGSVEEAEETAEETDEEEEEQKSVDGVGEKEEDEEIMERDSEENVEEAEEDAEETDEEEEEQKSIDEMGEKEEEVEVVELVDEGSVEEAEETDEEEEEQKSTDEVGKKEEEEIMEGDSEENVEEAEEGAEETDEEEEEQKSIDEMGEKEEEVVYMVSEGSVEEAEEGAEETDEEEEVENRIEELEQEEGREEMTVIIEERDKEEDETEMVSVENYTEEDEEEKEREQEEYDVEEDVNVEVENTEVGRAKMVTEEEEEEEGGNDSDMQKEQKCGEVQENSQVLEIIENNQEEESIEEGDDVDSFPDDKVCKNLLDTISYLQQRSSSCEEADVEQNSESATKYSSDVQCEDDKVNGTDTVDELETDEAGEDHKERCSSQSHPVEISQELLDFVNSALQSSSLTFTYDSRGNIRIEPDNARLVQTKQIVIPKSSSDSLYGLNCLPSPSTSDLSDYRPETSESGGYKSQDSVDIVTESGEEASEKPFPVYRRKTDIPKRRTTAEGAKSKLSVANNSEILESSRLKSAETSYDSGSKASREDLSYFSAASSLKADAEAAPEGAQRHSVTSEKDSTDGVLIDQGRWLLKENHLIRKSPPLSLGMYGNLDSTSIDTGQENTSEDSPPHSKTDHSPLAAISSSELEEMAKPLTPKCTYYNMPHGSDSDPFLDDSSIKSGKKDSSSFKGRGSKVSPTIDTSKTRLNKNGSLSSFASVEFKIPDKKVHPEGESSAVTQARRTSSGGGSVLQAQDSLDTLHVRCSQYCPIL